jgi:hypothetical protein
MKKLPEPDLAGTGSSLVLVAGVRCEAQKRKRETEVVGVRFMATGGAFVPARAVTSIPRRKLGAGVHHEAIGNARGPRRDAGPAAYPLAVGRQPGARG